MLWYLGPPHPASLRGRSGLLLKVTLQNFYSDTMNEEILFDRYNLIEVHF